jgi:chromosome segregation ATPase
VITRRGFHIATAILGGILGGTRLGPSSVGAAGREILDLQQNVNQLIRSQKDIQTALTQKGAVESTLMEQSADTVNKLTGTMTALQNGVQDMQADSRARHDTISSQVQGISENLQETLARMGKLNQQLADLQDSLRAIDASLVSGGVPASKAAPRIVPPRTRAKN